MNDYNYLTEHEKRLFGYIPSEYPPIEDAWNQEELETIEELNNIFNL